VSTVSSPAKAGGVALIVIVGLLNFHIPHFLIEPTARDSSASYVLELGLLGNVLGAAIAALGIYRDLRWGWLLGILIASISVGLYIAQVTVGLPGLPKMWLEPSRLLSLVIEVLFVVLASLQVIALSNRTPAGGGTA
jgi:hypothetical protein